MADTVNIFSAAGLFQRFYDWTDDRDAGETNIKASRFDQEGERIRDGINGLINQDVSGNFTGFKGPVRCTFGTAGAPGITFHADPDTGIYRSGANKLAIATGGEINLEISGTLFEYKGNEVWHAGNDGPGSGLDADTLDGIHARPETEVLSNATQNIAWALSLNTIYSLTMNTNKTFAAPTGAIEGGVYILKVKQDATGRRTITWHNRYKFGAATAPTLSVGGGKTDIITFLYVDGEMRFMSIVKGF